MSMVWDCMTLSDQNIDRVIETPPLIWLALNPNNPESYFQAIGYQKPGLLAGWFGRKEPKPETPVMEMSEHEGLRETLEKMWHGIHYLLTQTDWEGEPPLNFIVAGGHQLDAIDMGYGAPQLFHHAQLKKIDQALSEITSDELRKRFNPDVMMNLEIYPVIWDRDLQEDDVLGECILYYEKIKKFIRTAVANEMGMIAYLS